MNGFMKGHRTKVRFCSPDVSQKKCKKEPGFRVAAVNQKSVTAVYLCWRRQRHYCVTWSFPCIVTEWVWGMLPKFWTWVHINGSVELSIKTYSEPCIWMYIRVRGNIDSSLKPAVRDKVDESGLHILFRDGCIFWLLPLCDPDRFCGKGRFMVAKHCSKKKSSQKPCRNQLHLYKRRDETKEQVSKRYEGLAGHAFWLNNKGQEYKKTTTLFALGGCYLKRDRLFCVTQWQIGFLAEKV